MMLSCASRRSKIVYERLCGRQTLALLEFDKEREVLVQWLSNVARTDPANEQTSHLCAIICPDAEGKVLFLSTITPNLGNGRRWWMSERPLGRSDVPIRRPFSFRCARPPLA